jgi:hypothetical protein
MYSPKRINLHLPRSWNACTVSELESVARIVAVRSMQADRYHPFDMDQTKAEIFFALAGLEPLEPANPRVPIEQQYITVRFSRPSWHHPFRMLRYYRNHKNRPFTLYLWQINSFIDQHLKWLDGPSALTLFPYQRITRHALLRKFRFWRSKRFAGPDALMQDFSWQRYRFANDYMSFYIDQQNTLLRMMQHPLKYSKRQFVEAEKAVDLARSMFLATIFNSRVRTIDEETQKFRSTYSYQSNQHSDNAIYFRRFPDIQWQVVLFWWSGMMAYLQKKYPHCFKQTPTKGGQTQNPLDLYTRTTATMQKYTTLKEDDVNHQTFHIILQHLEDMAKENEEMERIRKKNKTKKK